MADIFNLADSWNDGATLFNGIKLNVTNTASAAGSKLLDLQVGGVSKAAIGAAGDIDIAGAYQKDGVTILDTDSTLFNVAVGEGSLSDAFLTGTGNVATGYQSMLSNAAGNSNVATGFRSLYSNVDGSHNVALGNQSLYSNASASHNFAAGFQSLYNNTTGTSNFATGYRSLYSNVGGNYNVAAGYESLYANTSGVHNLALLRESLRFNETGNYNVAAGYRALYQNVDGSYNVALGRQALQENVSGVASAAVGYAALFSNVSGDRNSAFGYVSLYGLTSGNDNVAMGTSAGRYQLGGVLGLTNATSSIFIGQATKGVDSATNQIVIGADAEGLGSNTTVLGSAATTLTRLQGNVDTDGAYQKDGVTILDTDSTLFNTSVGEGSLADAFLTGIGNVATGYRSLYQNTTGGKNVATGYRSLHSNTGGIGNVATGYHALFNNLDGNHNVGSGTEALFSNLSGDYNIASGYQSLYNNTGSYNIASGYQSLRNNVSGSYNVAMGTSAGRYIPGGTVALTNATSSVFVGQGTQGVDAATNQIVIGANAEGLGSNSVVLGDDSITTTALRGNVGIGTTTPNTDISILRDDANVAGLRVDQLGTGPARISLHVTDGGGDAYIGFGIEDALGVSLNRSWHMGVDNSDAEAFNISVGGSVGNTPSFRMDRDTGAATLNLDQEGGFQVRRNSSSLDDAATLGFRFTTTHGDDHAQIKGIRTNAPGSAATALAFSTRDASALVERLRIDGEGNVGIGTTTPNANAILDVNSTTKAFLPPRMTTAQKNLVAAPTAGMVVYDTTLGKLAVYTGAAWEAVTSA